MFFFYSFHNKNYAKTPTIDTQTHSFVVFQPFPFRLFLPVAMNVPDNRHRIFILEYQWIIIDKIG